MKIRYIGHACFEVSENGYSVIFDPYEPDNVPGTLSISEEANDVCCSHEHGDHNYRAGVKLKAIESAPVKITEISSYHDSEGGVVRGNNTIHVLDTESGLRAVHMGDIGHILEPKQLELIGNPDVVMIPVGGFYTVDARQAKNIAENMGARIIIPMHYRGEGFGYDVIGPVEEFTSLFPEDMVKFYATDTIEVTKDTPKQVAVLKFKR